MQPPKQKREREDDEPSNEEQQQRRTVLDSYGELGGSESDPDSGEAAGDDDGPPNFGPKQERGAALMRGAAAQGQGAGPSEPASQLPNGQAAGPHGPDGGQRGSAGAPGEICKPTFVCLSLAPTLGLLFQGIYCG